MAMQRRDSNPNGTNIKNKNENKKNKKVFSKKLLSGPGNVATKAKTPKENLFENIWSRKKFDIVGRKRKGEEKRTGLARSRAIDKRKNTLLKEYEQSGKSSVFLDKRIGEHNESLGVFDKAILRSQRERQVKFSKKRKFNLSDGEEDDFDEELSPDEDADEITARQTLLKHVNGRSLHSPLGGDRAAGEENKHKSKKEVMKGNYAQGQILQGIHLKFSCCSFPGETLKGRFPGVYDRCTLKDGSVAQFIQSIQPMSWNLHLRRQAFDWEIEEEYNLGQTLDEISFDPSAEDSLVWNDGMSDSSVKRTHTLLTQRDHAGVQFPVTKIWLKLAPSRGNFFAWTTALGKSLTLDNLQKRGIQVVNRCFLCKCREEHSQHLFRGCTFFSWIWSELTCHIETSLGLDDTIVGIIQNRACSPMTRIGRFLWDYLLHATWWNI